jgi:hypothetical protein
MRKRNFKDCELVSYLSWRLWILIHGCFEDEEENKNSEKMRRKKKAKNEILRFELAT